LPGGAAFHARCSRWSNHQHELVGWYRVTTIPRILCGLEVRPRGVHRSLADGSPGVRHSRVDDRAGGFFHWFHGHRHLAVATAPPSPYFVRATTALRRIGEDEAKNQDLSPVTNAVIRALESAKPKLRYPVASTVQRLLVGLRPILPQSWFEYLVMDNYKIR